MSLSRMDTEVADATADGTGRVRTRGTTLGRYLLLDRLGAGGMGVVYAAYDPELDRKVAVKILREERTSPERQLRLTREAQAMARLSHPNVIAVHDVGDDDGAVFVAMELVDGQNLTAWRAAADRTWREVVHVFVAAGEGLAAAHRKQLIHRDFKPDNVLLRAADLQVLVSDFGLARLADEASTTMTTMTTISGGGGGGDDGAASPLDQQLTRAGTLLGTPAYMSPEQHRGEPADARSDQFAFCVALYEALYNERPFRGAAETGLDSVDVLALEIIKGNIRPTPREPAVPSWLRKIVVRGLAPAPGDRWPSMDALLAALRHDPARTVRRVALAGAFVAAATVAIVALARGGAGDHAPICNGAPARVAAVWNPGIAAAAAAAFSATGKPYAADSWQRTARILDDYAAHWSTMHREACEATEVRHEQSAHLLDLRMACLDHRLDVFGKLADLYAHVDDDLLARAITAADALPPLTACADGTALNAIVPLPDDPAARRRIDELMREVAKVDALDAAGQLKAGLAAADALVAAAKPIGYPVPLADALYDRAHILQTQQDTQQLAPAIFDALAAAGDAHQDAHVAMLLVSLELANRLDGHVQDGLALVPIADALMRRGGNDPRSRIAFDLTHAQLLEDNAQHTEADALLRATIARQEKLDPHDAELGTLLMTLSTVLTKEDKLAESRQVIDRALALLIEILGAQHPHVGGAYRARGNIELELNDGSAAAADFHHELAIADGAMGSDSEMASDATMDVALADMTQGHAADAERGYLRARELRTKLSGPDHPVIARIDQNLAVLYVGEGDYGKALDYAQRGTALKIKLGAPPTVITNSEVIAGNALIGLRRFADARDLFAKILASDLASLPAGHLQIASDRIGLAQALTQLNDNAAAVPLLRLAIPVCDADDPRGSERAGARAMLGDALYLLGDHAGGRAQMVAARAIYEQRSPLVGGDVDGLAEVKAWLAAHP